MTQKEMECVVRGVSASETSQECVYECELVCVPSHATSAQKQWDGIRRAGIACCVHHRSAECSASIHIQNRSVQLCNLLMNESHNSLSFGCLVATLLWLNHSETSRERPKSAPYLRLKNSKRTSMCQSILQYRKKPKVGPNGRTRGDALRFFIHSVTNHQKKLKRRPFDNKFFLKSLTMPKKLKGGTLWDFSTSMLSQISKKNLEGPVGNFFEKKSRNAEKQRVL